METPVYRSQETFLAGGRGKLTSSVLVRGVVALFAALLANLFVWWVGVRILDVPRDFPPLAGPAPLVFFTTVAAVGAVAAFTAIRRVSSSPKSVFLRVAVMVLLLSFVPDLWLLSDGAAGAFPGATRRGVALLMIMHLVAAGVIVQSLAGPIRKNWKGGDSPEDKS